MKNTFGNSLEITLFGESHGPYIGAVLDGLAPGIKIDEAFICHQLSLRRPSGKISTSRVEADNFQIISGTFNGYTTGTPLCILIENSSCHSKDYSKTSSLARPGHADYSAQCKYHGFQDYRGGGHFSGRITSALVASAAIIIPELEKKGIFIASHILSCAGIKDENFSSDLDLLKKQILKVKNLSFAVLDSSVEEKMREEIKKVSSDLDSTGGVLETAIVGLPEGLGEPYFDSMESILSHAIFSIPAIKGIQFGSGFDMVDSLGSAFNDPFIVKDNKIITTTNNNGGINGGITNGMPIVFRSAIKPTPSIYKKQETVDFIKKENTIIKIEGRHDPTIVHRARVVVDSMVALSLYDILSSRYGTDFFGSRK